MPILPFGIHAPDLAALNNVGSPVIKNVFPGGPYQRGAISYLPVPAFQVISSALTARARGAISARDKDANVFNYAGDATKLYELTATTWGDVTNVGGAYTTGADERWAFARWKEKILAANFSDNPQSITFGDANFADLTTALKFRHITTIRDFVVGGNTFDAADGNVPFRVRWSAFNDETDWTISAITLADFQDLKGQGGFVQGVLGGDFGVIVQDRSTWRMTFVGSPTVFQFDETAPGIGSPAPGSIVQHGPLAFFLGQDGFVMLINGVPTADSWIGHNKVDRTVLSDIDADNFHRVSAAVDPISKRVLWAYPGAGNTGGRPNRILAFDWVNGNWSNIEQDVELLYRSASVGFTLDGLDDFALGAELVTNGAFAADTDWTKGTGWTIAAGVASHAAGTASDIEQTVAITENDWYRVELDISGWTVGSLTPKVGGTSGTAISANVTDNKETIQAGAGTLLEFTATSDFDGDLDNVSLKRVTPLDDLTDSLDSRTYQGGALQVGAFDKDNKSGFFSGTAMPATLETKELELSDGRTTHLNAFRPVIDEGPSGGVTVTAQVGQRNNQGAVPSFGSVLSESSSGRFTTRANARYHRIRILTSGDFAQAIGVQVDKAFPGGRRG